MEALSVLACGVIMSFASVEVVQYSCVDLFNGLHYHFHSDHLPFSPLLINLSQVLCMMTSLHSIRPGTPMLC